VKSNKSKRAGFLHKISAPFHPHRFFGDFTVLYAVLAGGDSHIGCREKKKFSFGQLHFKRQSIFIIQNLMKQYSFLPSMTSAFKGLESGIKHPTELQLGLHANTVGIRKKAVHRASSLTWQRRMPQASHPTSDLYQTRIWPFVSY